MTTIRTSRLALRVASVAAEKLVRGSAPISGRSPGLIPVSLGARARTVMPIDDEGKIHVRGRLTV